MKPPAAFLRSKQGERLEGRLAAPARRIGLLWEVVFLMTVPIAVGVMGNNELAMTCFIITNLVARYILARRPGDGRALALGIVAGGGNDLMSMIKGVYAYTPPHILPWPIPVWMILFWGQVFLLFARVFDSPAFAIARPLPPLRQDRRLWLDLALILILKMTLYRVAADPLIPNAVAAGLLIVRCVAAFPDAGERRLLALTLLAGPAYEVLLIRLGLYHYTHGYVLGMPPWLLAFWALSILLARNVMARLAPAKQAQGAHSD